jgi:O-antigen/teichoic acid export membrane protein
MAIEMSGQADAPRQYSRIFEYFLAGSIGLSLALGMFAPEVLAIFTRTAYVPAAPYAAILMAYNGPIIVSAALFSIGLHARRQTARISLAYLAAAPLNIALNVLMDRAFGIWGAVWATVIGGIALALVTYFLCQPVFPVPYRWLRASALFAVYSVLILIAISIPEFQQPVFKVGILLVYFTSIFALKIVSKSDVQLGVLYLRRKGAPS